MNTRQARKARIIARGKIYAARVTLGPMWHDGVEENVDVLGLQGSTVAGVPAAMVRHGVWLRLSPVTSLHPARPEPPC